MSRAFNRKTAYHRYLGQDFWRERREHILKPANGKCEKCGQRPPTEVHHLTYIRVFQELPSDLLAVCRQCHAEIHWRQPANDNQIQFRFFEEDATQGGSLTMTTCPICGAEAEESPPTGDFHVIHCPTHKFEVEGSAISFEGAKASREGWERALERAKLRAQSGKLPRITRGDFL